VRSPLRRGGNRGHGSIRHSKAAAAVAVMAAAAVAMAAAAIVWQRQHDVRQVYVLLE